MAEDSAPARKPRADAERNRLSLLEAARVAFAAQGTTASLEDVARRAGVGIGTLYRHFPTREALISEVYRNEAAKLADAVDLLVGAGQPLEALRSALLLFVDYLSTKLILAEALRTMMCDPSQIAAVQFERLTVALRRLIDEARADGEIGTDPADPLDLVRALAGIAMAGAGPDWDRAARRMVDILISGLRVKT